MNKIAKELMTRFKDTYFKKECAICLCVGTLIGLAVCNGIVNVSRVVSASAPSGQTHKKPPAITATIMSAKSSESENPPEPEPPEKSNIPNLGELLEEPAQYIAKTVWGEARGCSTTEQAAVIWCILNRVDSDIKYMPDDIISVITQKGQFDGYKASNPVTGELYDLTIDVLWRWVEEKNGKEDVGRVLPKEYLYFLGEDGRNYFTIDWHKGKRWDWSLGSPYED